MNKEKELPAQLQGTPAPGEHQPGAHTAPGRAKQFQNSVCCQFLLAHSCLVQREIRAKSGPQTANSSLNANLGFSKIPVHTKAQLRFEKQPELALKCLQPLFWMFPRQSTTPPYGQGSIPEENLHFTCAEPGLTPAAPSCCSPSRGSSGASEFPWEAAPGSRGSLKHQGFVTSWRRILQSYPSMLTEPRPPLPHSQGCSDHGKPVASRLESFFYRLRIVFLITMYSTYPLALPISSYFN